MAACAKECGNCKFFHKNTDTCVRMPPTVKGGGAGKGEYPYVYRNTPSCGEFVESEDSKWKREEEDKAFNESLKLPPAGYYESKGR